MGEDIFGTLVEPGSIVLFSSSAAQLDVAVVAEAKKTGKGSLIGYTVEYPYESVHGKIITKRKLLSSNRELVCLPASKLASLASSQAKRTDSFANRVRYLAEKHAPTT